MVVTTRRAAAEAIREGADEGVRGETSSSRASPRVVEVSRKPLPSLILHGSSLALYMYIWSILFRTAPPGANEFGWLLQYLTSFSFLVQTCILVSSLSMTVYSLGMMSMQFYCNVDEDTRTVIHTENSFIHSYSYARRETRCTDRQTCVRMWSSKTCVEVLLEVADETVLACTFSLLPSPSVCMCVCVCVSI